MAQELQITCDGCDAELTNKRPLFHVQVTACRLKPPTDTIYNFDLCQKCVLEGTLGKLLS